MSSDIDNITLGYQDIATTMNIYADVTKELKKSEFEGLGEYFKSKAKIKKSHEVDQGE